MILLALLKKEVEELSPSAFALAMATGIISVAAHNLHYPLFSLLLYWLNHVFYAVLMLMFLFRIAFYFRAFSADLSSHNNGAGFFTIVAATGILGSQHVLLKQNYWAASIFFYAALALWVILNYSYLLIMITKQHKRSFKRSINGAWLLIVVATQSVAILGTLLAVQPHTQSEILLFSALCFYLLGNLLYIILITLIFFRLSFFSLRPEELSAPFWIMMGAVAISTLTGSTLIQHIPAGGLAIQFVPFFKGLSLLTWATASWGIPLLVLLQGWRYFLVKKPIPYKSNDWSMVFCIGMYTTCTLQLAKVLKIAFLQPISQVIIWIALCAWIIGLIRMCYSFASDLRQQAAEKSLMDV